MVSVKNSKVFYLVIICIIILAVTVFAFIKSLKPTEVVSPEEEILEIKVQPQGELQYIPSHMVFHFWKSFPGVEGVIIEEEKLPFFITIKPHLTTRGKWISERTFELYFVTPPEPDKEYEVKILNIPLIIEAEAITARTFTFTTPPFDVLNASLKSLDKKKAVIAIDFNFVPVISEITKFIKVFDSRNKEKMILKAVKEKDRPMTVFITVPVVKAPEQYKVIVKRDLKSELEVSLRKDFEFTVPIGFTTKPITVRDHRIEEAEDGYMAIFTMSSTAERRLEIREENLKKFIQIEPEIKFRASSSGQYIYVFADFIPEKTYELTLKSGIVSKKGSIFQEDYFTSLTIPKRKEMFQFVYQGRYFGRTGEWRLPLKIAQICSVKVNITYVPYDNVLFWHLKDRGSKDRMHGLGETIIESHEIPVDKNTKPQIVWINLRDFIPDYSNGVYLVEAYGKTEDKKRFNDRIAVVISDISLVVKWYNKNIYVWAFNASNLEPENGVDIQVRSQKNFLTGTGKTDVNGFCRIPALKEGRDPYIVFARRGDEWTYAHTPSLRLRKEDYDVSGETPTIAYLAYIYPERDLYRPGEEVHFGVVIREPHTFKGISLPIRIKIRDPRGKDYLSLSGKTDINGLCEFSFPTTPSSPTGKYMLELVAGDRCLYTSHVFVETFVPERMRVQVSLPDEFDLYKPFPVDVEVEYLFGAPASGEEYTLEIETDETKFRCSGYYDYSFGMYKFRRTKVPSWQSNKITGKLNQNGKASELIKVDSNVVFQGPVVLSGNVTVTEGGSGRVTAKTIERIVYTRPFYIGLKSSTARTVSGIPVQIKGVLLKPDCSEYSNNAKLYYKIYRLGYSYSYRYYEDYYWDSRWQKIPVTEKTKISVKDGKFSFSFTPKASYNDYLIEVVDEVSGPTSQLRIAGWGWWWYREEEKIESPEVVTIRLDKKEYDANEQVNVEALLPFEGNILWTVELDTIYYNHMAKAKGEVAKWFFKAPEGVSTVYVSALLLRSGGNYLVQRGFGVERVKIRPASQKLTFDLDVPKRIRPGDELVIEVKGTEKFKGTIAVVDEGILQITGFQTPDPYEKILRDLRLLINSAESFGWIVKKFLEKTGGGFVEREKEFPEARFARIVSHWSGIIESGKDGRLIHKLKIPEYNGKLRVMVVGVNERRFGAAQAYVIVKSDVIVSPTIPRFMHTQDNFSFPITLINTTKKQREIKISTTLKGGKIKGSPMFIMKLKPEEKKITWLDCIAGDEPGSLALTINGISGKEKYHEDFVIPLYPNRPFITESEYITIKANEKVDMKRYFMDWYPKAHTAQLILSNIPALARLNHVRYAVRYPYGCIEQTSTSTLVLLRLAALLPVIAPDITKEEYTEMVNHGIRRIISMQTISGGFGFWPGRGDPAPWSSGYAVFVLLEARSAGFFVPEGALKAALNYLDALPDKSGFIYYIIAKGGILQKKPEMVDRLITLAKKEEYNATSALWIAGAIYESGKTSEAERLLEIALKQEPPKTRRYRGDFYSSLQLKGMRLYIIQNINPGMAEENALVLDIATSLAERKSYYYSTQELAWTMLSLGMYAERVAEEDFKATLKLNGKIASPQKEKALLSWSLKNAAKYSSVLLETHFNEDLYLHIENHGFSRKKQAFEPYANGIRLWRKIFDYSGSPVSSVQQGDLVIVRIAVKGNRYYYNVAVEAALAGGLEIENPRLGRDDLPAWVNKNHKLWHPDYVDIRDDRVIMFGTVSHDTLYYYTLARAVTPGSFFLPPTSGLVMYNPDMNAHTSAAHFEIKKR